VRLLFHHDGGRWQHFSEAFYTAHFELFLGNACLGKIMILVTQIDSSEEKICGVTSEERKASHE
jgi:hypothetical protein